MDEFQPPRAFSRLLLRRIILMKEVFKEVFFLFLSLLHKLSSLSCLESRPSPGPKMIQLQQVWDISTLKTTAGRLLATNSHPQRRSSTSARAEREPERRADAGILLGQIK